MAYNNLVKISINTSCSTLISTKLSSPEHNITLKSSAFTIISRYKLPVLMFLLKINVNNSLSGNSSKSIPILPFLCSGVIYDFRAQAASIFILFSSFNSFSIISNIFIISDLSIFIINIIKIIILDENYYFTLNEWLDNCCFYSFIIDICI